MIEELLPHIPKPKRSKLQKFSDLSEVEFDSTFNPALDVESTSISLCQEIDLDIEDIDLNSYRDLTIMSDDDLSDVEFFPMRLTMALGKHLIKKEHAGVEQDSEIEGLIRNLKSYQNG